MTKFLIIPFFLTCISYSQRISYTLYLNDQCENEIKLAEIYWLEKDSVTYHSFSGEPITVPQFGIYKLIAPELDEEFEINVKENTNSDTLNLPSIKSFVHQLNGSFKKGISESAMRELRLKMSAQYFECGITCNGNKVSKYSNGKIRFIGTFENGFPIGEFKTYYQNGNIKEVSFYEADALIKSLKLYDLNGNLIQQ
ncbi:toxin-antitoxin system YwqK family antitoxin [Flavobacterium pallidum]|uniref:Uncharacterized protein n=1 Tax=Flavobacterium pallidum TaxID=2172098 RepID=A0A2S1SKE1_9FLAO|nr:hypothetical protein [Flavobacterium pallidum]AWI26865.1 hypothetical protein HYN49_13670 [Flavobacterium pallidum]